MPKLSKKDHEDREARFQAAQQDFESGKFKTYAAAAREHRVSRVTLSNRIKGKHTDARTAQESQQKLSRPVEQTLLDWCIFSGMIGMPWTKETLMSRAQAVADPGVKITMTWCRRFLHRYRRRLKYKYAYELDPKRASGFNRPTVETYFSMVKKLIEDYGIPIKHIYNMDEKGLQIGGGRSTSRRKHIFGLLQKAQYKLKHDCLELMTIIECICADGFAMKPTFVHQPGDVGFWWENKEIGWSVYIQAISLGMQLKYFAYHKLVASRPRTDGHRMIYARPGSPRYLSRLQSRGEYPMHRSCFFSTDMAPISRRKFSRLPTKTACLLSAFRQKQLTSFSHSMLACLIWSKGPGSGSVKTAPRSASQSPKPPQSRGTWRPANPGYILWPSKMPGSGLVSTHSTQASLETRIMHPAPSHPPVSTCPHPSPTLSSLWLSSRLIPLNPTQSPKIECITPHQQSTVPDKHRHSKIFVLQKVCG